MTTARGLVLDYLQTLQAQGLQRLPVDDNARAVLRSWMLAARNGTPPPRPAAPQGGPSPTPVEAAPAVVAEGTAPDALPSESRAYIQSLKQELARELPPQAAETVEEGDDTPFFRPVGNNAAELWENFARLLPVWKPLRELGTLRPTAILGEGDRNADIMFVGDAPNYYDEKARRPFQGEAGNKLEGMLKAMGLKREQVYITHLVKFRPSLPRQTFNNRPPNEKEIRFSVSIVDLEARLVQPKVIVALGVIAARGLLGMGDLPLSAYQRQHGRFGGIPVVVTHHPSYLLRTTDLTERRRLWEEMLHVMEMVGLPISERQRRYFLK